MFFVYFNEYFACSLPRHQCVILFAPYLFLDDYLRHFSLQSTNVCRALKAFDDDALYKFTFYLLIYFLISVFPGNVL